MRTFNRLEDRFFQAVQNSDNNALQFAYVPTFTLSYLQNTSDAELLALAYILELKNDTQKLEKVNAELSKR